MKNVFGILATQPLLSRLTHSVMLFGLAAAIPVSRAQTPIAYYPLNGDGTDASGNGFNGSVIGTTPTTDRYGNAGGALLFVNDTDRVVCGNPSAFNFTGPFTISTWVNLNYTRENSYIVAKYDTTVGPAGAYGLGVAGVPYPYAFVGNGSGYSDLIAFAGPMNANLWYALAAVYDGLTLSIYENGSLVAQSFVGSVPPFVNDAPLTIGGTIVDQVLGGAIDDVRMYDRALDATEIAGQFEADLPPPPQPPPNEGGLVAEYLFHGGNGVDSSGNHLNGAVLGAKHTRDRFGKNSQALAFDGFDDRVNLGNPAAFNFENNFTLSAWIKMDGTQVDKYTVAKYDVDLATFASSPNCYGMGVDEIGRAYGFVGSAAAYTDLRAGPTLNDGAWHAVSFAYQGSVSIRLYVDGNFVGSAPVEAQPPFVNSVPLTIGGTINDQVFGGGIDDVRIYNKALSDEEVAAQYQLDLQ